MSNVMNSHLADLAPVQPVQIEISKEVLKNSTFKNISRDLSYIFLIELIGNELTLTDGKEVYKVKLAIDNNVSYRYCYQTSMQNITISKLAKGFTIINKSPEVTIIKIGSEEFQSYEKDKLITGAYNQIFTIFDKAKKRYQISFKDNYDEVFRANKTFRAIKGKGNKYRAFIKDEDGSFHFADWAKNNDEISCEVTDSVEVIKLCDDSDKGYDVGTYSLPHNLLHYLKSLDDRTLITSDHNSVITSDGSIFMLKL